MEFGQNINLLHKILKPYGICSVYGSAKNMSPTIPFGQYLFKGITIKIALIYTLGQKKRLQAINNLHKAYLDGALAPKIDTIYSLNDCHYAHDATLKSGRKGAILLRTN